MRTDERNACQKHHNCNCAFPAAFKFIVFNSSATVSSCCTHYTVRVSEHWHRLPREVVESPPLEILKSCLDVVLGNLLQVALLEHGGWSR